MINLLIGFIVGMLLAKFIFYERPQDCPAEVLGYDCATYKGRMCDHRKSELYKAHMQMALAAEERAGE